jgi:hypothetical protein
LFESISKIRVTTISAPQSALEQRPIRAAGLRGTQL